MPPDARRRTDDKGRTVEDVVLEYLRAMNAFERQWLEPLDQAIRSSPPSLTWPIATDLSEAYLKAEAGMRRDLQRVRDEFCTARAGARELRPGITDPPTFDPATTTIREVVAGRDGTVRVKTVEGPLATPHVYSLVVVDGTWRIDDRISSPGRGVRAFTSL